MFFIICNHKLKTTSKSCRTLKQEDLDHIVRFLLICIHRAIDICVGGFFGVLLPNTPDSVFQLSQA